MKLTKENLEKVFTCVLQHLENEKGGSFDEETPFITAIETVVAWIDDGKPLSKSEKSTEIKRILDEWHATSSFMYKKAMNKKKKK